MKYPIKFNITLIDSSSRDNPKKIGVSFTPISPLIKNKLNLELINIYDSGNIKLVAPKKNPDESCMINKIIKTFHEKDSEYKEFLFVLPDSNGTIAYKLELSAFDLTKTMTNQIIAHFIDAVHENIPLSGEFIGQLKDAIKKLGHDLDYKGEPRQLLGSALSKNGLFSSDVIINTDDAPILIPR